MEKEQNFELLTFPWNSESAINKERSEGECDE
jgi:hypothetical protein